MLNLLSYKKKKTPHQASADGWAHESNATTREDVDAADGLPLREIAIAFLLLIGGTICLVFARQAATGRLPSAAPGAAWGLLTVGLLAFLPGFYVSRIAYYAWRRREGYSFADIPRKCAGMRQLIAFPIDPLHKIQLLDFANKISVRPDFEIGQTNL